MWTNLLSTIILIINEVMASNAGMVMSPAINFDGWIEVYNPTEQSVNLAGMYLSDSPSDLKRWQMPSDIGSVQAHGFKVVWLGSSELKSNQAPFKLDCDGGSICLSDKDGQLIDSQAYPAAMSRTAYARTTDGGDEWGWTASPTPGATNATSAFASERLAAPVVSVGSRLFDATLQVSVDIPEGATLMYTTDGSLPTAPKRQGEQSPWKNFVVNGDSEGDEAVSLISRDADGNGDVARIVDGVGYDGSRGIRVHAIANAQNDYDAQLFVYTPDHIWRTGEKYRFRMKVRADKVARISAQTQTVPHTYIYHSVLDGNYDVTTQWKEIVYEGTITDNQVGKEVSGGGWWGGPETVTYKDMQTIAFNLNGDKKENNFYFDDVSWELYTADSNDADPTQQSKDGKFTIAKTTNYTFRLYQDGYLPSVPVTRSYIKTSNKYTLPVVSIVGNKKFFTDQKIGIDCDGDGTNGKTGNGQDWPRNYNVDWDRPVNLSYMTPEGEMLHNQDVNIKVSGGWTRSQRFRSFKLKANKIFDGQNRYDYSFFPQKPFIRSKTLLLRNGGNDVWEHNARFMDPALETIIQRSGIDLDVQSYVPVIEYVNGELRGVLNLREPNNDDFAYANFGYDDEELDAFENQVMKNGDDAVLKRIYELGRNINDVGAYEELCQLLDIDEFTNYMATTMYLDNDDWPNNNMKAYRSRNDGRYRFVSFDLDYAFALRNFNTKNDNPFTYFQQFKDATSVGGEGNLNREVVRLLFNLWGHEAYRRKFIDTFCLVAGSVFETTRANAIVDELLAKVKPMTQLMKQQGINDGHDPDRAANTIKSKLNGRTTKMTTHMQQFTPLKLTTAKKQTVKIGANIDGATILLNGMQIPYSYFNGTLFAPVKLEAKAPAGYRFSEWKIGTMSISTDETIDLPSGSSVSLTACFEPLSDAELAAQGITPVRINEVSAANGIHVNEYFKRNDWVELYNTTDEEIDIEGMYLSDNANKPLKYQITKGGSQASTVIPAHGFLIIWCDKLEPQSQLHSSFKLAEEGGDVLLTAQDESWTDRLTYGPMLSDQTAGRYPNGGSEVFLMNVPSISMPNLTSSYALAIEAPGSSGIRDLASASAQDALRASYTVGRLAVRGAASSVQAKVFTASGQQVGAQEASPQQGYADFDLSHLPSGIYLARVSDAEGRVAVCKFAKK